MTLPSLRSIFDAHKRLGSDKWTSYFEAYDTHFSRYRDKPVSLLEIGVQNGGSLEIWGKYFPKAERLIGCDIDEKCRALTFDDRRINVFVGDANAEETYEAIIADTPEFDIIVDDGSHIVEDVLRSFALYFPKLKAGGVYVVEDMHTSYWYGFGGGTDFTLSSMGFLKLLADLTNQAFWRDRNVEFNLLEPFAARYGLALDADAFAIEEVSFSDSVCIIRKGDKSFENRRHITGTEFRVVDLSSSLPLSGSHDLAGEVFPSDFLTRATEMQQEFTNILPKAIEIQAEADRLHDQLAATQAELERSKQENTAIRESRSWRLTAPLRRISTALR
ncbi:class I SAM-dependent methyltransferase [Rhizobium ruizarguesonis]